MNKQSVIALVVVVAVGSFGLGWWLKPVPEVPTAQTGSNAAKETIGEEEETPLTDIEQVALNFFTSAYIYADADNTERWIIGHRVQVPRERKPKSPDKVYIGTRKSKEDDYIYVYLFYPHDGDVYSIRLSRQGDSWKVGYTERNSVGPGGDYTFEEFKETESYQYLRVYEWKEAKAE